MLLLLGDSNWEREVVESKFKARNVGMDLVPKECSDPTHNMGGEIDHCLVSSSHMEMVTSMKVLQCGVSDHLPVKVTINRRISLSSGPAPSDVAAARETDGALSHRQRPSSPPEEGSTRTDKWGYRPLLAACLLLLVGGGQ